MSKTLPTTSAHAEIPAVVLRSRDCRHPVHPGLSIIYYDHRSTPEIPEDLESFIFFNERRMSVNRIKYVKRPAICN